VFLRSRISLFTIIKYGNCLLFSNTDMYKTVYRIITRICKHYVYFVFLFIYMLSCYPFSHIASLILSACCDIPPIETTKVPAYNAALKLDPLQTRNIKSKFPALVPTMNADEFVCNIYAVWSEMYEFENKCFLFFSILEPNCGGTVEGYHSCFVLGKSKFKMAAFSPAILTENYRGFPQSFRKIPR